MASPYEMGGERAERSRSSRHGRGVAVRDWVVAVVVVSLPREMKVRLGVD